MTRVLPLPRPSRFLLLAAALVALAVLVVGDGVPPAGAAHKEPTPTNLAATVLSATTVRLTWDGPAASVQYNVEWREQADHSSTGSQTTSASTDGGTYKVTGLTPETAYEFRVQTDGGSNHTDSDFTGRVTATTVTVLVSRINQSNSSNYTTAAHSWGQRFGTGSAANGYTLTSIQQGIPSARNAAQTAKFRAELWSATSGNLPDEKIADLTVPNTLQAGPVEFLPPAGTVLAASTQYFFVAYTTDATSVSLRDTESTSLDNLSQSGWTMANICVRQNGNDPSAGTWGNCTFSSALKIRVNGFEAQAVDPLALSALTAESSTDGSNFAALTLAPEVHPDDTEYWGRGDQRRHPRTADPHAGGTPTPR